jgi:TonB-dependent SusC/RagA subfamily outer membrane receptor
VAGTVTDESGLPLPGATILVENTNRGVTSDFDGNFSISASNGEVLIVSYVGYQSSQITVEPNANYSISLAPQGQLEEVVVTSLGIKREKQALGYAVSEVQNESLEQRAEGDIGRVLTGKASGVQITSQSGLSGSGTSIIIRGFNSFSQDNQPLFIVDGVPFSSETNASGRQGERNDFVNGNNGSSRFLDIDPNNIESVNILKGLAAATLYGTQGRNGVILITTKSGSNRSAGAGKNEITINSSYFSVALASKPDYQNEYGNGFDQSFGWFFSNWGPSFKEDGPAGWNGAALVITVDGEKESFTLGSNLSSGKFTKKIEGATTMSFVFESGEFDSEVSYTIVYQSLAGDNEQIAISDGPSPTPGEKILSICQ